MDGTVIYDGLYGVKYIWNKDENTLTIIPKHRFYHYNEAHWIRYEIYKLGNAYQFIKWSKYDDPNKVYSFSSEVTRANSHEYAIKLSLQDYTDRIYTILSEPLKIDLNNVHNNEETFNKLYDEFKAYKSKNSNAFIMNVKKSKYTIQDILNLGDIKVKKIRDKDSYIQHIELVRKNDYELLKKYYELQIPELNDDLIIKDYTYDASGNHIFKIINTFENVFIDVVLLGKEYTGQWWMHYLPPFYWNAKISTCERWILNIKKDDEIIKDA
ncbi:MAG: hypothetical protein QXZ12_06890 [Thermoplasmata archaeon]